MKYRLLALIIGLLSLTFAVACSGTSSDSEETPATGSGGNGETPVATATVDGSASGSTGPEGATPESATAILGDQDPVAMVNDEAVGLEEYRMQLEQVEESYAQQGVPLPQGADLATLRQQVMQQLVQRTLIIQESEARNITVSDEEVQASYQTTRDTFPDEATFNATLEEEGLTLETLRELISDNLKVEKLLTAVIEEAAIPEPTEEELVELYELVKQQQELPPFEEIREALVMEVIDQRRTTVLQTFIQDLEARSNVQILVDL